MLNDLELNDLEILQDLRDTFAYGNPAYAALHNAIDYLVGLWPCTYIDSTDGKHAYAVASLTRRHVRRGDLWRSALAIPREYDNE